MKKVIKQHTGLLWFHPFIKADHPMVQGLETRGYKIYFASTVQDAWLNLQIHFDELDVAILHREGFEVDTAYPGLKLLGIIRRDVSLRQISTLLTSDLATPEQVRSHPDHALRPDAVLKSPFNILELLKTLGSLRMAPPPRPLVEIGSFARPENYSGGNANFSAPNFPPADGQAWAAVMATLRETRAEMSKLKAELLHRELELLKESQKNLTATRRDPDAIRRHGDRKASAIVKVRKPVVRKAV